MCRQEMTMPARKNDNEEESREVLQIYAKNILQTKEGEMENLRDSENG